MNATIIVFIVFVSMTTVAIIIGLITFFCKRLQHKQIMAAIEKGTPLSELKPPKPEPTGPVWIKYLSGGVAMFIIGLAFIVAGPGWVQRGSGMFVAFIFCGLGLASLIRGLLYRKYQLQSQPLAKSNAAENRNTAGVSTPEAVQ